MPSAKDLEMFLNMALEEHRQKGHKPEEVAALVIEQFNELSNTNNFYKLLIYSRVQRFCIEEKISIREVDEEIIRLQN